MAIGEPKLAVPKLVQPIIAKNADLWNRYPPSHGTLELRTAIKDWLSRRYRLPITMIDANKHVVAISGSRAGLFMVAQAVVPTVKNGQRPIVVMSNPYYQVYAGATAAVGAEAFFLPALRTTNFLPDLDSITVDKRQSILDRTALGYVCSPSNPQGQCVSLEGLKMLILLARKHDFTLVADECYSEIYNSHSPPAGALEACAALADEFPSDFGKNPFANVVVLHSLSKRSSCPGLRSGFAAGDPLIIAKLSQVIEFGGTAMPLPIQAAATALWQDESHVKLIRNSYRKNFAIAAEVLGSKFHNYQPDGGFFLWLEVGDGVAAATALWREGHLRTLPGAFLSAPFDKQSNTKNSNLASSTPGDNFIRVALVHPPEITAKALQRLLSVLEGERVKD